MNSNLETSIKDKLRNIAREQRIDASVLWKNLVLERFLARLSKSDHSRHFILKGGYYLHSWYH